MVVQLSHAIRKVYEAIGSQCLKSYLTVIFARKKKRERARQTDKERERESDREMRENVSEVET